MFRENRMLFLALCLFSASSVIALAAAQSCSRVVLTHDGGMYGEDINGNPQTRFHVAESADEEGCPPKNSIVDVQAHFLGDVEARIDISQKTLDNGEIVNISVLKDIKVISSESLSEFPDLNFEENMMPAQPKEVEVARIISCSQRGAVGSGSRGLCCEGLKAIAAMEDETCERIEGGYYCSDCGNGVCEEDFENYCNCPEDCKK